MQTDVSERGTAATDLSDDAIVARVLQGETGLFELLLRRYNQRLYRVARGIVKNAEEAEDVVQEAYLNAFRHLDQFANRARFSTWLTKIAVYEAIARARRQNRYAEAPEGDDPMNNVESNDPDPERQAHASQLREILESAIEALPPAYRSVFVMREVEQLSTSETAECLDLSEDAIKMRLHRARGMLREDLLRKAGIAAPEVMRFDGERCDRMVRGVMARIAREKPQH